MKFSLKKYSTLLFVLIGIIVLYVVFNVINKKENMQPLGRIGDQCNGNYDCVSKLCNATKNERTQTCKYNPANH